MANALDLMYGTAAVLAAPWWMRKRRSGWGERFARSLPHLPPKQAGRARLLLHAVSVGEVNALRELVPRLTGEAEVVVSVGTDTGIARARELYAGSAVVVRYPLDASWVVRRFLDAVDPDLVALVELELWPNFIRACRERDVPVAVVNGRLSERSFRGYRRIRRWMAPSFASVAVAAVQDDAYAERFAAMGVARDRCVITGSMKYDSSRIEDEVEGAAALADAMGIRRDRPLVVAGSTGPGEEALLREALADRLREGTVQLLCAPRKPERFEAAAAALPGCVRRSAGGGDRGSGLFLLDSIGELRQAYSLSAVAVVGRSFFDQHGSDPIEPIALGKATVIGPAVSDFASIVATLEAAAGLERSDAASLAGSLATLLDDAGRRRALAERGRACVRRLQGASERNAELLLHLASDASPAASGPSRRARTGRGPIPAG